MTEYVQEHAFNELGYCTHCGGKHPGEGVPVAGVCVKRPKPAPSPARRVSALDDNDAVNRRIGELRAEATDALNRKDG